MKPTYVIPALPPDAQFETLPILRATVAANRALAELKGVAQTIPNQSILIDTLALQEARASSEIENIVTTQDDLYKAEMFPELAPGPAKEVALYRTAMRFGYAQLVARQGVIANRTIVEMFRLLKRRDEGFRTTLGTALRNEQTGHIVFVPPQDSNAITQHMTDLEAFMNEDDRSALDPLIKMAIIHHQFESIHPFSDGNGRIGRMLNVLYLCRTGLLATPILYLSRYVTRTKGEYYRLLQAVRDDGAWEAWVLYILKAVEDTSRDTIALIEGIRDLMSDYKQRIRSGLPKMYSQDLLNNLFRHPYTRIDFVMSDLSVSRPTATKYLERLTEAGFLEKQTSWRHSYYINVPLIRLFQRVANAS